VRPFVAMLSNGCRALLSGYPSRYVDKYAAAPAHKERGVSQLFGPVQPRCMESPTGVNPADVTSIGADRENGSSVTNPDVEISDALAVFVREAERALSALFHSVKDPFGEKAAFRVADGWLEILGASLASRKEELPKLRDITVQSMRSFMAPCTEREHNNGEAFPSDVHGR
jgi:hypothetical protein